MHILFMSSIYERMCFCMHSSFSVTTGQWEYVARQLSDSSESKTCFFTGAHDFRETVKL